VDRAKPAEQLVSTGLDPSAVLEGRSTRAQPVLAFGE